MRISIVTPCLNAEHLIEGTVRSVLNQQAVHSGRVELEYVIVDGQSSDRTLEIVQAVRDSSSVDNVKIISEPDSGLYDALAKGFRSTSGDICAYLNAGDLYSPTALAVVADMFELPGIQWLTGFQVIYNEASQVVSCRLPFRYRRKLFESRAYSGRPLPFVQQESTFWDARLHQYIDYAVLRNFKYAGDYYLWQQFARYTGLKIVSSYLGGYKIHRGQLSENLANYRRELNAFTRRMKTHELAIAYLDRFAWYLPAKVKKRLNSSDLFLYNHANQRWE